MKLMICTLAIHEAYNHFHWTQILFSTVSIAIQSEPRKSKVNLEHLGISKGYLFMIWEKPLFENAFGHLQSQKLMIYFVSKKACVLIPNCIKES